MTDAAIEGSLAAKAQQLGPPLQPSDVQISRTGRQVRMETRYAVHFSSTRWICISMQARRAVKSDNRIGK